MAGTYNIMVEQGATMRLLFKWETRNGTEMVPVDLTTYSARLQIRRTVATDPPVLSLSTGNGITLGADGSITIEATAAQTAAINIRNGVYDLELEDSAGRVTRLVQGKVTVSFEVTR